MSGKPFSLLRLLALARLSNSIPDRCLSFSIVAQCFLGCGSRCRWRNRFGGNNQLVIPSIGGWKIPSGILVRHVGKERQAIVIVSWVIILQHEILHFDPLP